VTGGDVCWSVARNTKKEQKESKMGFSSSAPTPPPVVPVEPLPEKDPTLEERDRRVEELERRRRGRSGTVETGFRGVLAPASTSGATKPGKTYLGE
jgi:hypothetical protein